jgi:energy-converting hydrogenase Eha subunit H
MKLTQTSRQLVLADPNYTRVIMEAGLNPWFATVEGDRFQRIGHSFAAILHGVAGGVLAMYLARRQSRPTNDTGRGS